MINKVLNLKRKLQSRHARYLSDIEYKTSDSKKPR